MLRAPCLAVCRLVGTVVPIPDRGGNAQQRAELRSPMAHLCQQLRLLLQAVWWLRASSVHLR